MDHQTLKLLNSIENQQEELLNRLIAWASINSYSDNLPGLAQIAAILESDFASLEGKAERIPLQGRTLVTPSGDFLSYPHGEALRFTKRPTAPIQVFLGGHMDTVYSPTHAFQSVTRPEANILQGPGVADMKGGLVIMLAALHTLEQHPAAENIGWQVLINSDEEVGSVGSEYLFREAAQKYQLGLIFEPSFADGSIVSSRKGSFNFSIIAKGKAAHAGRDFDKGRNAIAGLTTYLTEAYRLNDKDKGISINPGFISGGGPVNIVPEVAMCRINVRTISPSDFVDMQQKLQRMVDQLNIDGITLSLHIESSRGPKVFDEKSTRLFDMIDRCAKEEGYSLKNKPSGGVCDGNILAEEGMPVIDTLGAIGGEIHTRDEYILIDSLVKRSRLTASFLIQLASGRLNLF